MITESLAAEKGGLWGRAYVDGARNTSPGLKVGDDWLREVVLALRRKGIPVVFDDAPGIFPAGFPVTDCSLYYGWYTPGVAGPFADEEFRFVPGAVAVHIHSFSAQTLRDAKTGWVAPLLARGAAASLGNVYEPYLQLTSELHILNDRLLQGFTLAESAYMSMRALSWMNVVVGDPLYRPFATWTEIDPAPGPRPAAAWKACHAFAMKNSGLPPEGYRKLARLTASRTGNGPMLEDLGSRAAEAGEYLEAVSFFQQARSVYEARDDIVRVVLLEADAWVKANKPGRALALVRSVVRIVSSSPAAPLLRKLEQELAPPAGATPPR